MKNKIMMIAALGLVSAFFITASVKAEDAVVEPAEIQTQDKLQTKEQLRLKTGEKLQTKEQARLKTGKDAGKLADAEKAALKEQEKTRAMKGLDRADEAAGAHGQQGRDIARENIENAGERKALKNQEKAGSADEKTQMKQERKQERKQLRKKEHSSEDRGSRSENRGQNRGAGKRK